MSTFTEYQEKATQTAIYPGSKTITGLNYVVLGLSSESGEIAGKLKKLIRDSNSEITDKFKDDIEKELGDVLWYLAMICNELDIDLGDCASKNIDKLFSRKERGVISGSGDNR